MAPVKARRLEKMAEEPFIMDALTVAAMLADGDIENENLARAYVLIDQLMLMCAEAAVRFYDGDLKAAFGPLTQVQRDIMLRRLPAELFVTLPPECPHS